MVRDQIIDEFFEDLSSKSPTPGGGGASAVSGAMGVSLGLMVIALTLGKKKYAEYEESLLKCKADFEKLKDVFLSLADKDEEVFLPLSKAYSMPKETEEEKALKARVMEQALLEASLVPMSCMETAYGALEIMESVANMGSKLAISDAGVGASCLRTALEGAAFNVKINVKSMQDPLCKESLTKKADALLRGGVKRAEKILEIVENRL